MRDSAGVAIVELGDLPSSDRQLWQVGPTPALSIGQVEGPAAVGFWEISGTIRLADGRIVVADGSNEIRFYSRRGIHLRSVGRDGEGPGEFRVISLLARYGQDSLLVWDERLQRGTILSQEGTLGRVFRGPAFHEGYYSFLGAFTDGSMLGTLVGAMTIANARNGLNRVEATYFRFDLRTGLVDSLARLFDGESYVSTRYGMKVMTMPFGFRAVAVLGGDRIYYGSSESYEIRTYSNTLRLVRILRLRRPNRPLRQEVVRAFVDRMKSRAGGRDAARRLESDYRELPYHKVLPAYASFKVDALGNLWVATYALPGEGLTHWTVFDPQGCLLGDVVLPRRFTMHEIGSDYVIGVARDSLDVERVVLLALQKPS